VRKVLDDKAAGGHELRTADLGGKTNTVDMGSKIVEVLRGLLGLF
jgi:3-isopropylmalate dehydrogenase